MMATATGFTVLSYYFPCHRIPFLRFPPLSTIHPLLKQKRFRRQRFMLVNVKCKLEGSNCKSTFQSESKTPLSLPSSSEPSSSFTSVTDEDNRSISAYKWCAALGCIGFLETTYMTYLKLTGADIFCPMGGGSCTTILTSEFSSLFE
ncbi:hypothetical protein OROHE_010131 [Orobanche hederae]